MVTARGAKKAALKKAAPKQGNLPDILFDKVEMVDATTLKPHPKNPNIGDVETIKESILANGVYKPILYNERNGFMAAGHHTWVAMRELGYTKVPIIRIDVDEQHHIRIMLNDNESAKKSTYDMSLLNEVLQLIPDIKGTGFSEEQAREIADQAAQSASTALADLDAAERTRMEAEAAQKRAQTFDGAPLGEEGELVDDDDDTDAGEVTGKKRDALQEAGDELQGAFDLKEDMAFDGVGVWGIPRLRTDMLMEWDELPANLKTWAGQATKNDDDPDRWWLYNWQIDSLSGLQQPINQIIVAFYCYDDYFENWWYYAKKYVAKVLNSGIKYIVMPDYSMHTPGEESRVISLWSFYRNRWLARYFQECGLKVIPDVTWAAGDEDFLKKIMLPTYPKKIPLLAIQIQTVDENSEVFDAWIKQLQHILNYLEPQSLLVYHGKTGKKAFDQHIDYDGPVRFLESRVIALAELAKKRERKKTL